MAYRLFRHEETAMKKKICILMLAVCAAWVCGCSLFSEEVIRMPGQVDNVTGSALNEGMSEKGKEKKTLEERALVNRTAVTDTATLIGMSEDILAQMTLEEKVAQMFIVNLEHLDTSQGSYYEFRKFTKKMKKALAKRPPGGVILFARNIETPQQVLKLLAKLQDAVKYPLFVAVDEEGGDVARIANNPNMGTTVFSPMQQIGEQGDSSYVQEIGETIGRDISALGFNVDFAPVADVNTSSLNEEIGNRSFGSDVELVSDMVKNFVEGIQKTNVSATLKHFPGQGSSDGNTHNGAVNLETDIATLRKVDFKPFQSGIKAGADFIMVSHVSVSRVTGDTIPASMSDIIMNTILRLEFEFEGIVVTDAMDMTAITNHYTSAEAAVKAISAGADIVLMPQEYEEAYEGVLQAVKDGTISEESIDKSVLRILQVKVKRGLFQ